MIESNHPIAIDLKRIANIAGLALIAAPALAQQFVSPIQGKAYVDWTISNYTDRNLDPKNTDFEDYKHGIYSYNDHRGIDFTLPNFAAMAKNVPVYAVADGKVLEVRQGERDDCSVVTACDNKGDNPTDLDNFVRIEHAGGLITEYQHLMRMSVPVAAGAMVRAGDRIGFVGSSGVSDYPHLHFSVLPTLHDALNPLENRNWKETYENPTHWWKNPVGYAGDHSGSLDAGVHDGLPTLSELVARPANAAYRQQDGAQYAYFWAQVFGVVPGDDLDYYFYRPNGTEYAHSTKDAPTNIDRKFDWAPSEYIILPSVPDQGIWTVDLRLKGLKIATATFPVSAQATSWQGGISGNWDDFSKWNNGVPTSYVDQTVIPHGGPYLTGRDRQVQDILIGSGNASAHGTLDLFSQAEVGGGKLTSRHAYIGHSGQSSAAASVVGGTSSWRNSGYMIVGHQNTGASTLSIRSDGDVSSDFGIIGDYSGTTGTATVDGPGSTWNSGSELRIGNAGAGTLNITNGGGVVSTYGYIAFHSSSTGTATVRDAGSSWTVNGPLYVGNQGTGALNISGGADVSSGNGYIGNDPNSSGTVTLTGAGSTWTVNGPLYVGYKSTNNSRLNIFGGSSVSSSLGRIGVDPGASGSVSIGPGGVWNAGQVQVGSGVGRGSVAVTGSGSVSAPDGVFVYPQSSISGSGTISAPVFTDGEVYVGGSSETGYLSIVGNLSQSHLGTVHIELESVESYDVLSVNGNITLAGKLIVSIIEDFGPPFFRPQIGDSFDILSWPVTKTLSGVFDSVQLPTLPSTRMWNKSQLYPKGMISVVMAGDFNGDGKVDAADYVELRNGLGTIYSQNDINLWRANFGNMSGSGAIEAQSVGVPEPAGWCSFAIGIAVLCVFGRPAVQIKSARRGADPQIVH